MMYALMIRSGNDAAYTVAVHLAGSQAKFSEMMNERARSTGAKNTRFNNPHGLNDPIHLTTAYDLAMMTREALKNERVKQAAGAKTATIQRSINQQDTVLNTKNRFLEVAGSEGVKTGYTRPAGQCFVGAKSHNGWRLITVVLKSDDWLKDTCTLFDWAFANFERRQIGARGESVVNASVIGGVRQQVAGRLGRNLSFAQERGREGREPNIIVKPIQAPVSEGQTIGRYVVELHDGSQIEAPILAASTVPESVAARFGSWPLLLGAAIAALLTLYARRPRKRPTRSVRHA
jgi:D-alanyl-D-alanine carboxypeptidase (penicillin-binding protein 5/6)